MMLHIQEVSSIVTRANVEGTNNQISDRDDPTTPQANDPTAVAIDPVPGLDRKQHQLQMREMVLWEQAM